MRVFPFRSKIMSSVAHSPLDWFIRSRVLWFGVFSLQLLDITFALLVGHTSRTPPARPPYAPGAPPRVPAGLPADDLRVGGDPVLSAEHMPPPTRTSYAVPPVTPLPPLTGIGEEFLHKLSSRFAGDEGGAMEGDGAADEDADME